jgi:nucleotide-binding universal stress UspA family protein
MSMNQESHAFHSAGGRPGAVEEALPIQPGSSMSRMGIKHILACVDGSENDAAVLDYALQVALRFSGHIDVLNIRFDIHDLPVVNAYERYVDQFLRVSELLDHAVAASATRARRHFERWLAQCKLPRRDTGIGADAPSAAWRDIEGYEHLIIPKLGRLSDLIVVARPNEESTGMSQLILQTALAATGRPVLMVPRGASSNVFAHAMIAWNGSLEASRAVGFAMPFLVESKHCVDVFVAGSGDERADTAELLRCLTWHGVVGEPTLPDDLPHPVGESLLSQVNASGAGLLVMGAYGHGHYRQFIFGGVTQHVVHHAPIPVLMAH